jgi:uncharacterized membrane protein (UPF0127 family)
VIRHVALVAGALLLSLHGCKAPAVPLAENKTQVSEAGLALVPLEIRSGTRTHRFTVEVARTSEQQQRGLMYRPTLAPDAGMIFPFDDPRPASFWMKNTMIPLDMLFVRSDGTIASIAVNTVPYSLDPVSEGEPVAAVLEIAGGRSVELGIEAGDQVAWPR